MERVLITGAGGFVGSHLVAKLLERDIVVHAIDLTQEVPWRLRPFTAYPNFSFRSADVVSEEFVDTLSAEPLDVVFHLASIVGVNRYCQDPLRTMEVIVLGTRNVIRAVAGRGIRLLYTSTSEVYGRNPNVPWREDSERVLGPTWIDRWVYATSKALCEQILFASSRAYDLPVTILRYFNVYGPNQTPDLVVPAMIQKVLRDEPPTIIGSGEETRCFTFVSDVVEATALAAASPSCINQVLNIGSDRETRISELAHLILRLAKREYLVPRIVDGDEVYGSYEYIQRRVPEVSKAKELLGWQATTSLEEGLRITLEHHAKQPIPTETVTPKILGDFSQGATQGG